VAICSFCERSYWPQPNQQFCRRCQSERVAAGTVDVLKTGFSAEEFKEFQAECDERELLRLIDQQEGDMRWGNKEQQSPWVVSLDALLSQEEGDAGIQPIYLVSSRLDFTARSFLERMMRENGYRYRRNRRGRLTSGERVSEQGEIYA
jgi:hypothetical protein